MPLQALLSSLFSAAPAVKVESSKLTAVLVTLAGARSGKLTISA